ncbi:MAG: alpha/beta hydrolase [Methylacidiphilales bacterium]|nr:alpha/beta hydrolase [Candidatus Methylacidiphilales bacterium]
MNDAIRLVKHFTMFASPQLKFPFHSFAKAGKVQSKIALIVLFLASLTGCAPLATVNSVEPPQPVAFVVNQDNPKLKVARMQALSSAQLVNSNPQEAMRESINAARLSLDEMGELSGRRADEAIEIYNFSVGRLIDAVNASKMQPWLSVVKLDSPSGPIWLKMTSDSDATWNPTTDQLEATDRLIIGGQYFPERVHLHGVGAPLVSKGPGRTTPPWSPMFNCVPATGLVIFEGNQATLRILSPCVTTQAFLAGKTRPVAADLSAPLAVNIVENKPEFIGIKALLNASKYQRDAKLVMREPYHPGLQPVILIHGLMDSPLSWVPEINAFNANPELRKRYQIWHFQYSSAPPFPISAEILRENLAAVYKQFPDTPKAILVGHSMGGLLCHMLMCDSGTQYCKDILGKTVSELNLPPDAKLIRGALEFKACPYIAKVIFEATPHRGANMAANPLGRLGSMLVRLPVSMVSMSSDLLSDAKEKNGDVVLDHFPNSIDTFRPKALAIVAMNKLTLNPRVPFYSIIGDCGRGDSPNSSDKVVAYWSSHLDGAVSEKIVPYWHSDVLKGPETIAEVQRILLEP